MNLKFTAAGLLLALTALLTGCGEKEAAPQAAARPVRVETMTVKAERAVSQDRYSGTVEEENGTLLSFATAGTVKKVYVHTGQRVAAGQLLAELDAASLQSSHQASLATLRQAEDAYRRLQLLHEKGSLPEIKWVEAQSQVEQARSVEQIARKALQDARLLAPFAGVVAEKNVEAGQNVMPGTPVARLVTTSSLKVKIAVPEAEISRIAVGQEGRVEVPALGNRTFRARVVEKGVVAQALSRSYDVKLRVEGAAGGLLPGMVATVTLALPDGETVCAIPADAVLLDEHNREFVWLDRNGKAEKRYVDCEGFAGADVVVRQGLNEGDRVLTAGQQKVSAGTEITATEPNSPAL